MQSAPAQDWIRNIKTKKALDTNWVFAGSSFVTDETTGKKYYQADSGELICVLSLPTAMLDLPILSYGAIEARLFEAFAEHLPPPGTPVTILLKPILSGKPRAKRPRRGRRRDKRAEAEKRPSKPPSRGSRWSIRDNTRKAGKPPPSTSRTRSTEGTSSSRSAARESHWAKSISRQLQSKQYTTSLPGAPDGQYVVLQYKTSFEQREVGHRNDHADAREGQEVARYRAITSSETRRVGLRGTP